MVFALSYVLFYLQVWFSKLPWSITCLYRPFYHCLLTCPLANRPTDQFARLQSCNLWENKRKKTGKNGFTDVTKTLIFFLFSVKLFNCCWCVIRQHTSYCYWIPDICSWYHSVPSCISIFIESFLLCETIAGVWHHNGTNNSDQWCHISTVFNKFIASTMVSPNREIPPFIILCAQQAKPCFWYR